jgi:hypothetical protein
MLQRIASFATESDLRPEEIRTLVEAFDDAWTSLQSSGAPFAEPAYQETARDIIARSMIDAAKNGERNRRALIEGALLQLAKANLRRPHPSRNVR